jgi:hypothetical protein
MNPQNGGQGAGLSGWLVQRAAQSAPAALARRLEEEWLADLAAQRGALSRLRFALGCCWAMRVIAHDFLASAVRAHEHSTGHGAIALGQYGAPSYLRRTTIFFLIVCLHVFVIYGFATGLAQKVIQAIPGPMRTVILNQPSAQALPPPPIRASLATQPVLIPPLAPTFESPPDPVTTSVTSPPTLSHAVVPQLPSPLVTRLLGGPGPGFPNTDDYYPLTSRRMGETGVATVRVTGQPHRPSDG